MPKVSLFIPTLNAGPLLGEVLEAVDRQPGAAELEKLAIDSGSTDGTVALLEAHGFRVESIDKREFNHGATRDRGIRAAGGEVVVLLTQDATPADGDWLSALVACYDDPKVGAAYCKQLPRPDCNPFIARRLKEWNAGRDQRAVQECDGPEAFAALEPMQRLGLCAYDNVAGSVRRSAWAQVGGFGHRSFGEDVAFGKKLILDGWRIVFEAGSAVVHSHNRSAKDEGRRIYCDHQNLRDLFGLRLLPTWQSYRDAVAWGEQTYAELVDQLEVDAEQRAELHDWARQYAHWGALGMFLGAASHQSMSGPGAGPFQDLDRRMHAGI